MEKWIGDMQLRIPKFMFARRLYGKYAIEISGMDWMPYSPEYDPYPPLAVCDCWLQYRKDQDHSPSITIYLELFTFVLLDFSIYNVNHAD